MSEDLKMNTRHNHLTPTIFAKMEKLLSPSNRIFWKSPKTKPNNI